jgi:hypothetical protein
MFEATAVVLVDVSQLLTVGFLERVMVVMVQEALLGLNSEWVLVRSQAAKSY